VSHIFLFFVLYFGYNTCTAGAYLCIGNTEKVLLIL